MRSTVRNEAAAPDHDEHLCDRPGKLPYCPKPLKIGEIAVANRVLLAPMSGDHRRAFSPTQVRAAWCRTRCIRDDRQRRPRERQSRMSRAARASRQALGRTWSSWRAVKRIGWPKARGSRKPPAPTSSTSTWAVPARHVTGGIGQSGSALMRDLDHALET